MSRCTFEPTGKASRKRDVFRSRPERHSGSPRSGPRPPRCHVGEVSSRRRRGSSPAATPVGPVRAVRARHGRGGIVSWAVGPLAPASTRLAVVEPPSRRPGWSFEGARRRRPRRHVRQASGFRPCELTAYASAAVKSRKCRCRTYVVRAEMLPPLTPGTRIISGVEGRGRSLARASRSNSSPVAFP